MSRRDDERAADILDAARDIAEIGVTPERLIRTAGPEVIVRCARVQIIWFGA